MSKINEEFLKVVSSEDSMPEWMAENCTQIAQDYAKRFLCWAIQEKKYVPDLYNDSWFDQSGEGIGSSTDLLKEFDKQEQNQKS